MAEILDVTNVSYSVKEVPELFIKAMKKGGAVSDNFTVIPNITKDAVISKFMGVDDILQADNRDCSWNPSEGQEMGEKTITVKNYKINVEECLEKLDNLRSKQIFESDGMNSDMPADVYEAFRNDILRSVGLSIEKLAFGTGADSLITKLSTDGDVVKVSATTLTAQNILEELGKVYDAMPEAVLADQYYDNTHGKGSIFVPLGALKMLRIASQTSATENNVLAPALTYVNGKYHYNEIEIVPVASLGANTMVVASKANLVFGTNLLDELTSLDIERGACLKDKNKLYGYMDFRAVADYVFGDEIVLYV